MVSSNFFLFSHPLNNSVINEFPKMGIMDEAGEEGRLSPLSIAATVSHTVVRLRVQEEAQLSDEALGM